MAHCDLETGAVIFYESFQGFDGPKDRYFIVIRNSGPLVECFTTTTQPHAEKKPKLATEFCELAEGECCLPKRCFVDFRRIQSFGDIELGSRLRSKSVKELGSLPNEILRRIRSALASCRSLSPEEAEPLLVALDEQIESEG